MNKLLVTLFRLSHPTKARFECPACAYRGPFRDIRRATGNRIHAQCPACGALERHRLQSLVVQDVFARRQCRAERLLHLAPESFFRRGFETQFGTYVSGDVVPRGVHVGLDVCAMPFPDASFDVVYASHVLEHVRDDVRALREIRRILSPGGLAILPVPLVASRTIEYPQPNPAESMHVRAPGPDYFDRYHTQFPRVELFRSTDFPERFQTHAYEDRTAYPNSSSPLREPMPGHRHVDIVPVCHV